MKKLGKIDFKIKWFVVFSLIVSGMLVVGFLGVYLIRNLIEKEVGEVILKRESGPITTRPTTETTTMSAEIFAQLNESGVERFFLSKVEFVDYYKPTVYRCLFSKDGFPVQPNYIYATWSVLYYPKNPPYEIALVRFLLLEEDNRKFQLNKICYLKEIKDGNDWEEVGKKYGFFKNQF